MKGEQLFPVQGATLAFFLQTSRGLAVRQLCVRFCGCRSMQAYPGDIEGSVPEHGNKASSNLFAVGGPCLQFVRNATSVQNHKAKHK